MNTIIGRILFPCLLAGAVMGNFLLFWGFHDAHAMPSSAPGHMEKMPHEANTEKFSFGEAGVSTAVDRTVNITMKDLSFEPAALHIKAGETIRFIVTNSSDIDHDFTVGDTKTQKAHRKEMAEMMQMEGHHGNDPNAVFVKAGEIRELIWKFTRNGLLEFDCNVPGHFESGMKGRIFVTRNKSIGR